MRKRRILAIVAAALLALTSARASEALTVAAKGAVLIDGESGRILFAQNENEMLPEASCTKIMTALVALENSALDEDVTAGKNAHGVEGTSLYLSEGETLSMEQMLYGLMLRSGNDAAVAIAEHVAGSVEDFAAMMNRRAEELNADAHFVNPHGLDAEGHRASALGLARIMRAAMQNADFRTITGTQRKVIPWVGNEYSRVLENKNRLLSDYEGATGGKTGFTSKAGRCLVFSAERDGLELIGVVLNCYTWFDTATVLLDYGFEHFRMERALSSGEVAGQASVLNGDANQVDAVAAENLAAAVEIGSRPEVEIKIEDLEAPVKKGQVIGRARLICNGQEVDACNLIAAQEVPLWSFRAAMRSVLRSWSLPFA